MSERKWVQHISQQGDKWEINEAVATLNDDWCVWRQDKSRLCYYLPKSEYSLCQPPERWEDVTMECEVIDGAIIYKGESVCCYENYRFRKLDGYKGCIHVESAFLVEKRQP